MKYCIKPHSVIRSFHFLIYYIFLTNVNSNLVSMMSNLELCALSVEIAGTYSESFYISMIVIFTKIVSGFQSGF